MKLYRGIFTSKLSQAEVLERKFVRLPSDSTKWVELMLSKILGSDSPHLDGELPTSFTDKREVGLRHVGCCGWLLAVDVNYEDLVYPVGLLERSMNCDSDRKSEFAEALEISQSDHEVFLKPTAGLGSIEIQPIGSIIRS